MKKLLLFLLTSAVLSLVGVLIFHNVDNSITESDQIYISKILEEDSLSLSLPKSFEEEIRFIMAVQNRVLSVAPINQGIPEGSPREPENLYNSRYGLCYDRSRVIEKILRTYNFKTRHITVLSTGISGSTTKALLTPGNESHALLEVLTQKGWMFVDSNAEFIGLDNKMNPIDMKELSKKSYGSIDWHSYNNLEYKVIYQTNFTYVIGLYSRHGRFYPPYNSIPDINWQEFSQNLIN
ncbi:transglutaminase domain-containing protein [Cesiribacter sp. SM1]|uniref:transglutaminase domain-containing protein n=1 Tax=Cesiribacter sp. SM1 TaxID=2861196 RepID=UPI001CD58AEF|nr:transglutaminase domain-containing protein [Cesiribacter sp. SM1]